MQEELKFYYNHHARLLHKFAGKYLLLKGWVLIAAADTKEELEQYAAARYQPSEYLIHLCSIEDKPTADALAQSKKRRDRKILAIGAVLVALGLLIGFLMPKREVTDPRAKAPPATIFSQYDGSVPALTKYIKDRMNDPSSFQHVETKYLKKEDSYTVAMKYRGKNPFNATITKTVTAKVSLRGEVIEILMDN